MTPLSAAVCAAVCALGVGVIWTGAASVAAQRAQAAADLAALSGAQVLRIGGDACGEAGAIAEVNGSRLVGCRIDGQDVVVRTEHDLRIRMPGPGVASAAARAGP